MLAKDAFDCACIQLCEKYQKHGFKYIKSKKQIRSHINGADIVINIETSRDNSSDYFVYFKPHAYLIKNDKTIFSTNHLLNYINKSDETKLFGENLTIDISTNNESFDSIQTRMWIGSHFHCWNVAYPEQQTKAAEEAAIWLDKYFFAKKEVAEIIQMYVKSS
ncbi:MAG: hypothetical protein E7490_02125 [Ruminococcaceae bacterium]|nr:hypothetical protein [Oscillospiraceae bacterium]